MLVRPAAVALVALIVIGCTPIASSPTPTVSSSPTATASPATPSPATTPSTPPRLQVSDAPLPAVAGAFVLFQLPGETRLRAISFGADVSGVLPGQIAADAVWYQSPYGAPYLVGPTFYDRDGKPLGTIPWPAVLSRTSARASSDGRLVCAAVPAARTAGAQMRLETAVIGQPAKPIASGFATYNDNSTYPVLACDEGTDRALVAQFAQGVVATRLWVFRLSTGAMIRSVDYAAGGPWLAASADGTMLAESVRASPGGKWTAIIRSADDGGQLGTIDDFVVQGFSGDGSLVVGPSGGTTLAPSSLTTAVIDWKTGRKIWSTSGLPYGGFLAEPAGRRFAVGVGFVGGSDVRDVYLVSPDGSAVLLPERARFALLY